MEDWEWSECPNLQSKLDPQAANFQAHFKPTIPINTPVSELINEGNQWNERLVYCYFEKVDADGIVGIPLPRRLAQDQILWHYEKRGQYTVKSGYQVALRLKFPTIPSSSIVTKNQQSIIWILAQPEKTKIFIQRAANNVLPLAENLQKKRSFRNLLVKCA